MKRRDFLKNAGIIGGGGLVGGTILHWLVPLTSPSELALAENHNSPLLEASGNSLGLPGSDGFLGIFAPEGRPFDISAIGTEHSLTGGESTAMNLYRVSRNGKTWYNPILRVKQGEQLQATLHNELNQETIIHWHGMHLNWKNDGHPSQVVGRGESYTYDFTVKNRGGTYWYHPHPHGLTGLQVVMGLAGLLIVEDENDRSLRDALDLELGMTELPLVIQDRRLDRAGNVLYDLNHMEGFLGYHGDSIMSNYLVNASLDVETRIYRLRILNGSNSRTYRLAFTEERRRLPFHVIGVDGGFLEEPREAAEVFLSPGERLDLLVDFSQFSKGDTVFLRSLEFDPMIQPMGMMGRGMMGGFSLPPGAPFPVTRFEVKKKVSYDRKIPSRLSDVPVIEPGKARVREFRLGHSMMQWLINDHSFQMMQVVEEVNRGETEIWEIRNSRASQPHPMHIHGFSFKVLERIGSPSQVRALAVDNSGRQVNDFGMKDTVLVWPGETVRIAIDFTHGFPGEQLYLFHCHMLEHSDRGMMVNYRVS